LTTRPSRRKLAQGNARINQLLNKPDPFIGRTIGRDPGFVVDSRNDERFTPVGTTYTARELNPQLRKSQGQDRSLVDLLIFQERFVAAAEQCIGSLALLSKIHHPNIIRVLSVQRDRDTLFLVMEHMEGQTLSELIEASRKQHGFLKSDAQQIVQDIGSALWYAHSIGICHSELAPVNVVIAADRRVKLVPFGFAQPIIEARRKESQSSGFWPDVISMTQLYTSCELIEGRDPEPSDDVFSLGCIAYELIAHRRAFKSSTLQACEMGMKLERPNNLTNREWRALRTAISFRRETRTATVAKFLDEFCKPRFSHYFGQLREIVAAIKPGFASLGRGGAPKK
jgi:serine/threonine protein kinase